jgi:putative hydrolase of the HAD superfamily
MAEPAPSGIRAIVSDFGGVLTTPLINSFAAFQDQTGISGQALGRAMQAIAERDGEHPLFVLETGQMTEADFLTQVADALEPELGHRPEMHSFKEVYFKALEPNEPMIGLMREIGRRGYRMALLTNNVREWEHLWRSMLPVDEIFELVIDSAFVGMRKPDAGIYELMIARLAGVSAEECLFVDDVEVNVDAARAIGMAAVHFRSNEQAVPEVRGVLQLDR